MDIRRVFLDRLGQQRVDQADDRRLVVAFQEVGGFGNVLRQVREVGIVVQALQHLHGGAGTRFVGNAQHGIEGFDRYPLQFQGHADEAAHFRQALRRHTGAADRICHAVDDAPDQYSVTLGEWKR